jgi:hypothetical protein
MVFEDVIASEICKWCGRELRRSYVMRLKKMGIVKGYRYMIPVLCICGGITLVGANTTLTSYDEIIHTEERKN